MTATQKLSKFKNLDPIEPDFAAAKMSPTNVSRTSMERKRQAGIETDLKMTLEPLKDFPELQNQARNQQAGSIEPLTRKSSNVQNKRVKSEVRHLSEINTNIHKIMKNGQKVRSKTP